MAISCADAGIQKTQIVIDLRYCSDRRSRIPGIVLLPDCESRTDALNVIYIGTIDALQELPCVGRERSNVPSLPLGIERIEGKAALAAARYAGEPRSEN
jgi:hypothetical protein